MRVVRVLYQFVKNAVTVLGADHFVQVPETLVDLDVLPVRVDGMLQHGANLPLQVFSRKRIGWLAIPFYAAGH